LTQQPNYLRYLEAAKQAEIAEALLAQGYTVEREHRVGDASFDLIATKGPHKLAYEFKAGRSPRTSRQNLQKLQEVARDEGFEFRIVVVNPPPRVHVEVETLRDRLFDYMLNEAFPDDLDHLSTHTRIEGLSDLEISDIRVRHDEIRVAGTGAVDVELQYGSGSDQETGMGSKLYDSYPFDFIAILDTDGGLVSVEKLAVDTSSFYQ
jgi:hypothetical protein